MISEERKRFKNPKERARKIAITKFHKNKCMFPSEHPTLYDIYWAAGIYEGEGWADTNNQNSLRVCIGQKNPWILQRLKRLFGGSIYKSPKDISRWTLCGIRATGFAMTIYPILSPHRQTRLKGSLKEYLP